MEHGRNEKCIQNFGHICEGKDHMKDVSVVGRVTLKWILKEKVDCVCWIYLVQDRHY
jgi:hypothetical protein